MRIEELYKHFKNATGVTTDTRNISEGQLFFALKGDRFNGNTYAQKAIELGCSLAIIDEDEFEIPGKTFLVDNVLDTLQQLAAHHRQQLKTTIIGLTGSNGKTTTKELVRDVLATTFKTYATHGNLNNHIGVPLSLLAIAEDHEFAVIEMGANAQGEIAFLCSLSDPDFGLITNIGKAHLEGFGGLEGVKKGKKELFDYLGKRERKVFVNVKDDTLLEISNGMNRILYGSDKCTPDVYLLSSDPFVKYGWSHNGHSYPVVSTQLAGSYNLNNIAAAIAVGAFFGVSEASIDRAIAEYHPNNNRSERRKGERNTLILDAYNANPSSMANALESFQRSSDQNKMCILGDMFELGEASKEEHERVVALCRDLGLSSIFVGQHFSDAGSGASFYSTTEELMESLKRQPLSNQTILIKGSRGMQLERIVPLL